MCLCHHFHNICSCLNFSIHFFVIAISYLCYVTLAIQHHCQHMDGSQFGTLLAMDVCSDVESSTDIELTVECGLHNLYVCNYLPIRACININSKLRTTKSDVLRPFGRDDPGELIPEETFTKSRLY